MTKQKEYLVLMKQEENWPSKVTEAQGGMCFTVIARDMDTNVSYKTWPDTTWKSYSAWNVLKEGDIITDVSVYNETKKVLSAQNFPRVVGHKDLKSEEVANPKSKAKKTEQTKTVNTKADECNDCHSLSQPLHNHLKEVHQVSLFNDIPF